MSIASAADSDMDVYSTHVVDSNKKIPRLSRNVGAKVFSDMCFFCSEPGEDMRQVLTKKLDERVLTCLKLTNDSVLLGKRLISGDMIGYLVKLSIMQFVSWHCIVTLLMSSQKRMI